MINIIKKLFENNEYTPKDIEYGTLFSKINTSNKIDYWFVVEEENIDSLIDEQEKLFQKCKEVNNSDLKKNISMLIVWNTGGRLEFIDMKKKIMRIEENPYYFKKHVLYYSPEELLELKEQIADIDVEKFFTENISNETNFAQYKLNPTAKSWRELFYRIVIKLPFIGMKVDDFSDIESVQSTINYKLLETNETNKYFSINNKIFELYADISDSDLENKDVSEIVSDLLVVLEETQEDGN